MEESEYLENRLKDQINWYSKKSTNNKCCYHSLKIVEIAIAPIIPFLTGLVGEYPYLKFIIGSLGVSIAIIASILLIFKFHEKWMQYRITSEALKQEQYLYLTKSGIYNNNIKPFELLVEKVEFLISKENSNWNQIIITTENKTSK